MTDKTAERMMEVNQELLRLSKELRDHGSDIDLSQIIALLKEAVVLSEQLEFDGAYQEKLDAMLTLKGKLEVYKATGEFDFSTDTKAH